ncbi:MAG: carboxypeptidase-like regulatory domain-containing protein [Saprospiraceae bacterium]
MQFKKTNNQFSFLLRLSVAMSLLFVLVNNGIGQDLKITKGQAKQINQPSTIQLIDLLENLQEATGFTFVFDEKIIQNKTVSFDKTTRQNLNRVLIEEIAQQTNLSFDAVTDKIYTIKRVRKAEIAVRGIAKDKAGNPMIGANITLLSEGKGVTSNETGYFELIVQSGRHTIRASYVGYESISKEIEIDGYADIALDFEFKKHLKLEEILVVGNRFLPKTLQETAVHL